MKDLVKRFLEKKVSFISLIVLSTTRTLTLLEPYHPSK